MGQKRAASKWYKKGYTTHGKLSKKLGVSRQKVSNWLKSKKLGKRVEQPFWKSVKYLREGEEISFKEARRATYNMPKWARKRAERQGKEYKSFAEFWKEWREKWRDATQAERDAHGYEATYGEEGEFVGGTPH
jgi:transcriptional regulator with XRE-family HTH domain